MTLSRQLGGRGRNVPWWGRTDSSCQYCHVGQENLCRSPTFTGWDMDGGYADMCLAEEAYATYALPDTIGHEADEPPTELHGAILFAPAGHLVPVAMRPLARGGTLAVAGIYLSEVPAMDYDRYVYQERKLGIVTANTRADGEQFLTLAQRLAGPGPQPAGARSHADRGPETATVRRVTPQERRVLALIAEGLTNRRIGETPELGREDDQELRVRHPCEIGATTAHPGSSLEQPVSRSIAAPHSTAHGTQVRVPCCGPHR